MWMIPPFLDPVVNYFSPKPFKKYTSEDGVFTIEFQRPLKRAPDDIIIRSSFNTPYSRDVGLTISFTGTRLFDDLFDNYIFVNVEKQLGALRIGDRISIYVKEESIRYNDRGFDGSTIFLWDKQNDDLSRAWFCQWSRYCTGLMRDQDVLVYNIFATPQYAPPTGPLVPYKRKRLDPVLRDLEKQLEGWEIPRECAGVELPQTPRKSNRISAKQYKRLRANNYVEPPSLYV
jgi:hypothetical protein